MIVRLPYGKSHLAVTLPDGFATTLIEPVYVPRLSDPSREMRSSLRRPIGSTPLKDLARPEDRVGVIFNDITRPTPNKDILEVVLGELSHIPGENITLFNALGTHRPNTDVELRQMLGDAIVDRYRIVQNNSFDRDTQICLGRTSRGHEIWLNRDLYACDLKVLTGFIEPHFFAGFSGGGKAIMPGMAGQTTIFGNHDAGMIGHPKATWGITWGNPIWEEVREVALQAGRLFLMNVTLNKDKEITGVFSGGLDTAHAEGCTFVQGMATRQVSAPFDVVLTTNSGYPLDLNLYQAVKGMCAASQVIRPGGSIVIAAECWDGLPDHGLYADLLRSHRQPQSLLDEINAPGPVRQDQWQAQIQAQILGKADIYVYSDGLSDEQIRSAMLKPARNLEATLSDLLDKYGPGARLCVLPEGPQTIPFLTPTVA